MGVYLNPMSGTKEAWLAQHATEITLEQAKTIDIAKENKAGNLLLVLVNNGMVSALLVVMTTLDEFISPADIRPKRFYTVPLAAVERDMPSTASTLRMMI